MGAPYYRVVGAPYYRVVGAPYYHVVGAPYYRVVGIPYYRVVGAPYYRVVGAPFCCHLPSLLSSASSQSFSPWLMRMAQKWGPHMVQYLPPTWLASV